MGPEEIAQQTTLTAETAQSYLDRGLTPELILRCCAMACAQGVDPGPIIEIAASAAEIGEKRKGKNPHAVALGRRGGRAAAKSPKGLASLSPERRKELSQKGVEARWGKKDK